MAVLEFGRADGPVDLVFVHANGFNAMTYRSLLAPLARGRRIWAPDLRGHGRTRLPTPTAGRRSWADHRDDLIALLDRIDGPAPVLVGHSMGATSGLLAAARRPGRVRGLLLMDPVIWSRPAAYAFQLPGLDRMASRAPITRAALRRRARFADAAAALAAYRGRGAFRGWSDAMIADYLADGLAPDGDDGVTLTCTPQWEASNYAAQSHDPWSAFARYPGPVRLLKAETGSTCRVSRPPTPRVAITTAPGGGHLFPMVMPDLARAALREALDA